MRGMMSRRGFLTALLASVAVALTPVIGFFQRLFESEEDKKCRLIAQALETEEGRIALAQAMVEPIRRNLEYQSIGRKLLMVDELPQGALARYERDVGSTINILARRKA